MAACLAALSINIHILHRLWLCRESPFPCNDKRLPLCHVTSRFYRPFLLSLIESDLLMCMCKMINLKDGFNLISESVKLKSVYFSLLWVVDEICVWIDPGVPHSIDDWHFIKKRNHFKLMSSFELKLILRIIQTWVHDSCHVCGLVLMTDFRFQILMNMFEILLAFQALFAAFIMLRPILTKSRVFQDLERNVVSRFKAWTGF